MLCDGQHPVLQCSPAGHVRDFGDLPLPNTGLSAMRQALGRAIPPLLAAHHMVWLGGDHSVTLPILQALKAQLGRPLAVIHFDAHCDTWQDHFGEPSGHGTWVYEALEEGLAPVYLSLDIDCLDPAFAPGTGTPEPAGLSCGQVMTLLEDLTDLNFVGMDCVEVAPPYDHAEITAYAAASFVWTHLAGRLSRQ